MFEEFYEMYEPEEREVVVLINRIVGGGYHSRGGFWSLTVKRAGVASRTSRSAVCESAG